MDFNFSVNAIFREKLSKVGSNLVPHNYVADRRGDGDVVSKVSTVLDKMGVVSAKAQKLPSPITSASKLRNSDHVVYVITDWEGNRGHGSVIGILKVGHKKLFIYDLNGTQWEMSPLCILDFYVHESKQRAGFGKMLFDFMLQDRNVRPNHLALDQPSESFLSFMCKHYGLDSIIPQIYNFVVYDSFFNDRSDNYRCTSSGANNSKNGGQLKAAQKVNKSSIQCVKATGNFGDGISMPMYGRHSAKKAGCTMAEYMQDGSTVTSNGIRQGHYSTNPDTSHLRASLYSEVSKHTGVSEVDGQHLTSHASASSSLSCFETATPGSVQQQPSVPPELDWVNSLRDGQDVYGTEANSPEEVVGKLDLKFHHTHLCQDFYSTSDEHLTPSALKCSIGKILREDVCENHSEIYINGVKSAGPKPRRVSNIPIGNDDVDYVDDDDDDDPQPESVVEALHFKQNGDPHVFGTDGVRDVRIKKTNFKNLSPYRKW